MTLPTHSDTTTDRRLRLAAALVCVLLVAAGAVAFAGPATPAAAQSDGTLVVDDYEDAQAWESTQNNLGYWTDAGSYQTSDVADGTLTLEYDGSGWFVTKVLEDVSEYDQFVVVARGETGTEGELEFKVGQSSGTIADLSGQSIDGEFSEITVDFADLEFDQSSPGEVRIEAYSAGSGTIEIEEIAVATAGSAEGPTADFTGAPEDPIEPGDSFRVTQDATAGDAPVESYEWEFDDGTTATGAYATRSYDATGDYDVTLTVTDENGLTDTATQTVQVREPPSITGLDVPDQLEVGESYRFDVDATAGDAPVAVYEWDLGDGTTAFTESPQHAYQEAGDYTLTVTVEDQNGLTTTDSASLSVVEATDATLAITDEPDGVLRTGERFGLAAQLEGDASPERYEWDLDDGTVTEGQTVDYSYASPGEYQPVATVETQGGDVLTNSTTVTVEDGPGVEIVDAPTEVAAGSTVDFQAEATAGGAPVESVEWAFGDGDSAAGESVSHTYDQTGTYTVEVWATDEHGFASRDTVDVEVSDAGAPVAQVTSTFRKTPEQDHFEAVVTVDNPEVLERDDVDHVRVEVNGHTMQNADPITGFEQGAFDDVWLATDGSETPTIEFTFEYSQSFTEEIEGEFYRVNRTVQEVSIQSDHAEADAEQSDAFADGTQGFAERDADAIYLGEHERNTTETDHGRFTLIRPAETEVWEDPEVFVQGLHDFSDAMEVTAGHESVVGIASAETEDDVAGRAYSQRFHTNVDRQFTAVGTTWIHEFAHTTDTSPFENDSIEWYSEAYAEYYAALMPLEIEHSSYESDVYQGLYYADFVDEIDDGVGKEHDLTDWEYIEANEERDIDYDYGALVIGNIDRLIRANTEDATFADVVNRLEEYEPRLDHDDLITEIREVAGDEVAIQAEDWITAQEHAEPWTVEEHEAAFGYGITRVSDTRVTGVVDGERRELSADSQERIDVSEPLQLEVTVENPGSSGASHVVELEDEGKPVLTETVDSATVTSGDSTTVVLEWQFQEPIYSELDANHEAEGAFANKNRNLDVGNEIVALDPSATLVRAVDDTTASDPATVEPGNQLALQLDTYESSTAEVDLVATDGSDQLSVPVGENYHLATTNADQLQAGTTYEVRYPAAGDDEQYVHVVDDTTEGPTASISGAPTSAVTTDDAVDLTADVTEGDAAVDSYDWTWGDGTPDSGQSVSHSYDAAGDYTVELTVTDANGETDTDTVTITVEEASDEEPHAEIVPTTYSAGVGDTVGFDMDRNSDWIEDREWDMGDGTTYSGDWYVNHEFDEPGTYTVSLEVLDRHSGTRSTDTVTIEVS